MHESDAQPDSENYHLWRLNVTADLPGTDINRDFDLPVYATATESSAIPASKRGAPESVNHEVFDATIRKRVRIVASGLGKKLIFPMGQAFGTNASGMLVGTIFTAAGWLLVTLENAVVYGSIFGGVGALIALIASYMMFKSLEVTVRANTIHSARHWLGIPLGKKSLRRNDFVRFDKDSNMQSRSGNRRTKNYKILGVDWQGRRVVLGEGFLGEL